MHTLALGSVALQPGGHSPGEGGGGGAFGACCRCSCWGRHRLRRDRVPARPDISSRAVPHGLRRALRGPRSPHLCRGMHSILCFTQLQGTSMFHGSILTRSPLLQELAEGRSLGDLVKSGWRADEAEVVRIGRELLQILQYLSSRRPPVVHRSVGSLPGPIPLKQVRICRTPSALLASICCSQMCCILMSSIPLPVHCLSDTDTCLLPSNSWLVALPFSLSRAGQGAPQHGGRPAAGLTDGAGPWEVPVGQPG